MNDKKLNQLFAAARRAPAPPVAPDFADDVLRAVRREPPPRLRETPSVFAELNVLFPRVATIAAAIIIFFSALDFGLTSAGLPELGAGAAEVTSNLFFNPADL